MTDRSPANLPCSRWQEKAGIFLGVLHTPHLTDEGIVPLLTHPASGHEVGSVAIHSVTEARRGFRPRMSRARAVRTRLLEAMAQPVKAGPQKAPAASMSQGSGPSRPSGRSRPSASAIEAASPQVIPPRFSAKSVSDPDGVPI